MSQYLNFMRAQKKKQNHLSSLGLNRDVIMKYFEFGQERKSTSFSYVLTDLKASGVAYILC